MAKKKKTTKKGSKATKQVAAAPRERSPFLAYVWAILLMVFALFILLGAFHTGGNLPVTMFDGLYAAIGGAAYLTPLAVAYWGLYKFTDQDHIIPLGKKLGVPAMLLFAAGALFTAFATSDPATGAYSGGHGGKTGEIVGGMMLSALDKFPATVVFLVLALITAFFTFGISFDTLKNLFAPSRREREDKSDVDLTTLHKRQRASEAAAFKVNDTNDEPEQKAKGRFSLKNSMRGKDFAAEQLPVNDATATVAAAPSNAALTIASDPNWEFPSVQLLNQKQDKADAGDVNANAQIIKDTFENFSIAVEMEGANVGPRVTQYTLRPPTGVKLTKITALENNLALDLAAHSIRMEAPIPGQRAVGIEVPNVKAATVRISSLLQSKEWRELKSPLGFVIGRDIAGMPIVADLAKMPHLLVAGQTGSGKSVMINDILTSMLYRSSPSELKLILVDPKQVEMAPYNDLPHLLTPVITEPEKCISALKWAVAEMERRYKTLAEVKKRNIAEYNNLKNEDSMPYIVIVIDELADLMMMAARDVEALIVRIAQKARAVGIHLVLATQRPSVDVITGLIKANIPARIAFTVASQVDSRTIIDQVGAEKLLGRGDMLLLTSDMPKPKRVQAALIDDDETAKVTAFIQLQRQPEYNDDIISQPVQIGKGSNVMDFGGEGGSADEDMLRDAVRVVIEGRKASTSLLQRRLRIGYGRAARLIEEMEEQGIISAADGNRPREVLVRSVDEVFGGGAGDDSASDESGPSQPPQRPLVQ